MRWEVTRLFDLPPPSVDVVPNGIHLDTWHVPEQRAIEARDRWAAADAPFIAYTGRLEYEKGVHTLLRALPRLRRRFPGLRLVVAGTGTHEADLRALARSLRLGRAVTFTGFLDQDVLAVLAAAADVAVVPSIYEPFGMVALEAAAAGTPLVVADTGSRPALDRGTDHAAVPPASKGRFHARHAPHRTPPPRGSIDAPCICLVGLVCSCGPRLGPPLRRLRSDSRLRPPNQRVPGGSRPRCGR